jgi:hypothetical protein
MSPDM